ncbi:hypothetical protein GA0070216_14413 [Micromonospora matsumotoense]|uniref:HTH cro/C1-type domain-containing protein n=1 Tax=Micromonospora matsumotoense TaxID=121616 RepID=A0A1C5AY83_9ACTN|nr:hypothetical protein [Micromonospora matsumotoense]SCF50021.1 hypothetical protein GA0070216_14413 [Micromonospora matsumotoense]
MGKKKRTPNGHLNTARTALASPSGSGRPMSRQELADACNLELARQHAAEGGQRWAGLTDKTIGVYERGEVRWPNSEYRRALCAVLKRDEPSLGLYIDRPSEPDDASDRLGDGAASATAGYVPPAGSWPPVDRLDTVDDVKRRAALAVPALALFAAAVPSEPWNRLAYMLAHPQQLDEPALEQLETHTADLFRKEEHLPARQLAVHLGDHVRRLEQVTGRVPEPFARRVLMTTGEALALAGWVAWDSKQHTAAQDLYARAVRAAQAAGDGPLLACVLAYQSYGAEADGNLPYARQLLIEAQAYVRTEHSAATRAWLAAREAEVNAALGESTLALRALDRALTAYDYARPHRERSWTGFFTPSRLGSMTVTTYARLDHADLDTTTDAVVTSLPSTDAKIKAVILADVAMAAVQRGRHDRGAVLGHQALEQTLTQEASLGRQRLYNLHLMIQGKRGDAELAELDDRLLAHVV